MKVFSSVAIFTVFTISGVAAQDLQKTTPKTKLEAFTGTAGAVLLKGYTEIGSVKGSGSVRVTVMTFRNAATSTETSGILIQLLGTGSSFSSVPRSYVDYDEIKGLLEGIDYIAKADSSVTKLRNFEAIYSTKGDLKITVFNQTDGKLRVAVEAGRYSSQNVFFALDKLKELRALIVKAREVIDKPKSSEQDASEGGKAGKPTAHNLQSNSPNTLFSPAPADLWKR